MAVSASKLTASQKQVIDEIVAVGKMRGESAQTIALVVQFANAESTFNPTVPGAGTIKGLFQYSNGTWGDSLSYVQAHELNNPLIQGDASSLRLNLDAQITVMYSDMARYRAEFDSGKYPTTYAPGADRPKALIGMGYNVFGDFSTYAYLRHNTNPGEVNTIIVSVFNRYGINYSSFLTKNYRLGPNNSPSDAPIVEPARADVSVTHFADKSTTYEFVATFDSADGFFKKGDTVSQTYNFDGTFSSTVVYHQNGITESIDRSGDGAVENYAKWDNNKLVTLISTDVATQRVLGDFLLNGNRYSADGNLLNNSGSSDQIPVSVNPVTITPKIQTSPLEADAQNATSGVLSNSDYALCNPDAVDWERLLPNTNAFFLPTGNVSDVIGQLRAQGYTVTQTENSISALKDDGSFISADASSIEVGANGINAKWDINSQQIVLSQLQSDGTYSVNTFDAQSLARLSTGTIEYVGEYDATIQKTLYVDGRSTIIQTNEDGTVLQRIESQPTPNGSFTKIYDGANNLLSTSNTEIQNGPDGQTVIKTTVLANGHVTEVITTPDGTVTTREVYTPTETLTRSLTTTLDALSLITAIQSGNLLPIAVSGLRLATHLDINNLTNGAITNTQISAAADVGSGILSVLSLANALKNGDTLGAVTSGAQAISFGASAYTKFVTGQVGEAAIIKAFPDSAAAINGLNQALPYLNVVNSLVNGDYAGAALYTLAAVPGPQAAVFAPVALAYTVFNAISDLFGGDSIPAAWGNGHYTWNGPNGIGVQAAGETGGQESVSGAMNSVLSTLQSIVNQQNAANPNATLGIIPNRLPSLNYGYDIGGFQFSNIDPITGVDSHAGITYDTSGRPFNAPPGSPESFQSLGEAMLRSAIERGAIAPTWEVNTAFEQTQLGLNYAGLSEEERAVRMGNGNAGTPSGSDQTVRLIGLDLDGNGIQTIDRSQSNVAFDVDDSGYLKHTGWIGPNDGILTLDRNDNGTIDGGSELFNNARVAAGCPWPARLGLGRCQWGWRHQCFRSGL